MRSRLMTLTLVLAMVALTTSALAQDPIAHYPLANDAVDATGNYGDMDLEDCPFQDGGIYCNGSFWDFTCQTPLITGLSFETFTFMVDFKIEGYHAVNMPVMWLGYGWRTLGFEISPDGFAGITVGSGDSYFFSSDVVVTLGEWHTARISWNADMGFASCYMDGELIMFAEREPINPATDKRFLPKNGSYGRAFEGILKDLYIFNTDELSSVATQATTLSGVKNLFR